MQKKLLLILLLSLAVSFGLRAMTPPEKDVVLSRAVSLLEKERWSDARHEFERLREIVASDDEGAVQSIEYGLTVCAARLDDNVAVQRMQDFLSRYPGSVYAADVHFLLALHYCENDDFVGAKREFVAVPYKSLTAADKERYDVRMGYIEFLEGNHQLAFDYFARVPATSDYRDHATYYKSYIYYLRNDYDSAWSGFMSLKDSDAYAKVVPYYILQIEFARGNYKYVVRECDALIQGAADTERLELIRIAAESWYRLEGYNKALQYIAIFARSGGKMEREENYILGYSAYRTADYATAVEPFKSVCKGDDSLAQNASYHLADCYIKLGDKRLAAYSFAMAADEKYANEIAEDALFNYGKLLFETGGGTFNESINVLTRYVTKYPSSPRAQEARELLIAAYYNSHDYDMAYRAIRSFPSPDGNLKTALQKITYFKGLEQYKAGEYVAAREALEESQAVGVSPKYGALSSFWLGEIAYKTGDYKGAVEKYNYYVKRAPRTEREYKMALYNLGYAHMALNNMPQAKSSFEGFLWLYKDGDSYRADGYNRLGDVHYLQRDYDAAVKSYEKADALNTEEQYYACYRRAVALGLVSGGVPKKIEALKTILKSGDGDYVDDAGYELGRTYVASERYKDGATVLEDLVARYPSSPYYTPAMLDLGLIYFNLGRTERSLACYDKIISVAPQSAAAKDAMQSVREIYVSRGDVASYFAYAERTGVECDLSVMTRDSLTFRAAQKVYLASRHTEAVEQLENYLHHYPRGYYVDDALFCLSDSYLKCDSLDRAVERMKVLAERPKNSYTVTVLEKLGEVTFDNRMYAESATAFRRLYDVADNVADRTAAATKYVKATVADGEQERVLAMSADVEQMTDVDNGARRSARFAKANVLSARGDKDEPLAIYKELSVASVADREGAESAYNVIRATYESGDAVKAENLIYDLADKKTPQTYWLGRAFVILGNIYADKGDAFQARATYQSIIDGYMPADDGVVDEAKRCMEKLN
ncbi:MAG: tetratricopeptide repeat protein [Alistipes sp.]|nr:tetratricopeptide repeat protein [Alistipes sp.]